MWVTCPKCDEEFDAPRRDVERGAVECPGCGREFAPRRGRDRDRNQPADRSGLALGVMVAIGLIFALAVGGGVFLLLRAVNRPPAPEVVEAPPQQGQPAPRVVPPGLPPVMAPPPPAVRKKVTWAQAVGTWQAPTPVQGYPVRLVFRADHTGEITFDRDGDVITHPVVANVQSEGERSLHVQLQVNMGMYGYSLEFPGPDRLRLVAGGTGPEYARVK